MFNKVLNAILVFLWKLMFWKKIKPTEFYLCDTRLVKFVYTDNGGMDVLVFSPEKDEFIRDFNYHEKVFYGDDIEELSEEEFNKELEKQRKAGK